MFWMTALSPEPVCLTTRFQPGEGTNESIPKPLGGVSSISVVVRAAFSVGTARVKSCRAFDLVTGGLISACAQAREAVARPAHSADRPPTARASPFAIFL